MLASPYGQKRRKLMASFDALFPSCVYLGLAPEGSGDGGVKRQPLVCGQCCTCADWAGFCFEFEARQADIEVHLEVFFCGLKISR